MDIGFNKNNNMETEDFFFRQTDLKTRLMQPLNVGNSTLLICNSGKALVVLYNKKHLLKKGDVLIANWDMHPVFLKVSKDFSTDYLNMSDDMFYEVFRNVSSSFCQFVYNYPIFRLTSEQLHQLKIWHEQLYWLDKNIHGIQKKKLIIHYLQSLMVVIDEEILKISQQLPLVAMPRQLEILREFGALLQSHVKEHHDVAFYAHKLLITPYYLSTITSKVMQETPKSLIDKQLVMEMKKSILINTPLKVIADQLHFEDTSYMSRFFKKHTKLTPSEYREKTNWGNRI